MKTRFHEHRKCNKISVSKKLFICIFCFLSTILLAQEKATSAQEKWQKPNWKQLLSKLDTTQIKSGVLLDKVTSFANLLLFNTEKQNTSDKNHFIQAMSELYRASNKTRFMEIPKLKEYIKANTVKNQVVMGIINTNYEKLNISQNKEKEGGLIYNDTLFIPIKGAPSFLSRKLFIAAPLVDFVVGTTVDYKLMDDLIINNATSNIKSLTISFDNGKDPISLIKEGKIVSSIYTVQYETEGLKTLQFNVVFDDDVVLSTYATIAVMAYANAADLCTDTLKNKGTFTSSISFQGYDESAAVFGQIEYETFYATGNELKKMNKPIIIVDGFDPGDKRKVQDCDCQNDPTCLHDNSTATTTWTNQTVNGQVVSVPHTVFTFNPDSHDSIEDSMKYTFTLPSGDLQTKNVLQDLRDLGYDVIVINNPTYTTTNIAGQQVTIDGGADYIERNGSNLVSFIKDFVKPQQNAAGSNENLVLMGPSMGGQITRYALAYMEKQYADTGDIHWKHNARLWVSIDSPHLGANVPVGAQANIWFMGYLLGKQEAKDKYDQKLNAVAAKQMTISQFQNALDTHTYGYAGGGQLNNAPFFDTYYNTINNGGVPGSGGYPVSVPGQFRKIAIANGSLTGLKEGYEGQEFLGVRGYLNINPFAYAAGGLLGAAFFTDFFDHLFGSSNNVEIDMINVKDYFAPNYGASGVVFDGSGLNSHFSLHLFGGCDPCMHFENYTLNINNNDLRGSIDVAPGGVLTHTIGDIRDGIVQGSNQYFLATDVSAFVHDHSFMPSFTSLAHKQPWQNWSNPLNYNLTCQSDNLTPFDSYYGATNNKEHVSFTNESVTWLKKELAGDKQAPWFPIKAGVLIGDNVICDGETKTYSISDVCKVPSPVENWSVQGYLQIVQSSISPYSVAVKATSNSTSIGKIIATFQNGETFEKIVNIGSPSLSSVDTTIGNIFGWYCAGFANAASPSVTTVPTATSYRWQIDYDDDLGLPIHCTNSTNPSLAKFTAMDTFGNNNHVTSTTPAVFQSVSPKANINWGNCTGNYLLSCYAVNDCGETPYLMKYVTVGTAASNPCAISTGLSRFSINPNPVSDGTITVNFNHNQLPCDPPSTFSGKMASMGKEVKIYDMNGTEKFSGSYNDEETFSIKGINLISGNYILSIKFPDGQIDKEIIVIQ